MPATASPPPTASAPGRPARPPLAPSYAPPAAPSRRCRDCCAEVPREARKCQACGEWLVRTSSGVAAPLLRLLGWLWGAISVLAAAMLWYVGGAVRERMVEMTADAYLTPLGLDLAVYALVALVLLQGLTVSAALNVLARLAPRRPYWWS